MCIWFTYLLLKPETWRHLQCYVDKQKYICVKGSKMASESSDNKTDAVEKLQWQQPKSQHLRLHSSIRLRLLSELSFEW